VSYHFELTKTVTPFFTQTVYSIFHTESSFFRRFFGPLSCFFFKNLAGATKFYHKVADWPAISTGGKNMFRSLYGVNLSQTRTKLVAHIYSKRVAHITHIELSYSPLTHFFGERARPLGWWERAIIFPAVLILNFESHFGGFKLVCRISDLSIIFQRERHLENDRKTAGPSRYAIYSIDWSPCNGYIATAGGDNSISVSRSSSSSS
jgi:hypothetical protein